MPLAPLFVCLLALIPVAVMIGGRGDAGTLAAVGLTVAVVVGVMGSVA